MKKVIAPIAGTSVLTTPLTMTLGDIFESAVQASAPQSDSPSAFAKGYPKLRR